MALEGLTVKINANTEDFQKGMKEAEDTVAELKEQLADYTKMLSDLLAQSDSGGTVADDLFGGDTQRRIDDLKDSIREIQETLEETKAKEISQAISVSTQKASEYMGTMAKDSSKFLKALLGVRTAYSFIRKAMSTYLAQNEELQARLNACWYALGSLMAPILEYLVKLFTNLVLLVDEFVRAIGLGGIKMKKVTSESQKSLASFDEINNLNAGQGSGAGGVGELDTSSYEHFKEVLATILPIVAAIVTFVELIKIFGFENWQYFAGISIVVAGILTTVEGIVAFIKDPSWNNFLTILEGISIIVIGIGIVFGSWPAIIAGAVGLMVTYITKHFEKVKQLINTYIINPLNKVIDWINSKISNISFNGISLFGKEIVKPFTISLGNIGNIPSLDVGTNYVPQDQLAMIHQGEAIIPKEFNSGQYFNNEETNNLLRTLISTLENKEFSASISSNDVGRASMNYINNLSMMNGGRVL